jgi:hypothetical protein
VAGERFDRSVIGMRKWADGNQLETLPQKRSRKMSDSMRAMRVVRRMSQSLCIVLLVLACRALSAQNEEHRVRNVVLVHGAWADGSGWKGVYDILVKDG